MQTKTITNSSKFDIYMDAIANGSHATTEHIAKYSMQNFVPDWVENVSDAAWQTVFEMRGVAEGALLRYGNETKNNNLLHAAKMITFSRKNPQVFIVYVQGKGWAYDRNQSFANNMRSAIMWLVTKSI